MKRFHTRDVIKENTVAQHSFGVAWFCWMLMGGHPSAALLMHALAHDLPEWVVGDIPAPAKKLPGVGDRIEQLEEQVVAEAGLKLFPLTDEEQRALKIADRLEGLLYCAMEARRGNLLRTEYYTYLCTLVTTPMERRLLNDVVDIYNAAVSRDLNILGYQRISEVQDV